MSELKEVFERIYEVINSLEKPCAKIQRLLIYIYKLEYLLQNEFSKDEKIGGTD